MKWQCFFFYLKVNKLFSHHYMQKKICIEFLFVYHYPYQAGYIKPHLRRPKIKKSDQVAGVINMYLLGNNYIPAHLQLVLDELSG